MFRVRVLQELSRRSRSSCDIRAGYWKLRTAAGHHVSTHLRFQFVQAGDMSKYLAIFAVLLFCQLVAAQFGSFFEHMFQGENPGRQQRRPPGADHWRAQADASEFLPVRAGDITNSLFATSSLLYVSLPRYPCVRGCALAVPLPECGGYQVPDSRCIRQDCWHGDLCERWRLRRRRRLHERLVIMLLL